MSGEPRFIEPSNAAELAAFDRLNWDYLAFLRDSPADIQAIINTFYPDDVYREALAKSYMPPDGLKRLAMLGDAPRGCGTIQTIAPGDAEIKRVYVAPEARGTGLGKALMHQLILDCQALGFRRILMDTGRHLGPAQALYDQLGFTRREPYYDVPPIAQNALVFFEMSLD